MKVYILYEISHIEQEDVSTEILGVFSTKEKASEHMKKTAQFLIDNHNENYPFVLTNYYICGQSGHTFFDYEIKEVEVDA